VLTAGATDAVAGVTETAAGGTGVGVDGVGLIGEPGKGGSRLPAADACRTGATVCRPHVVVG